MQLPPSLVVSTIPQLIILFELISNWSNFNIIYYNKSTFFQSLDFAKVMNFCLNFFLKLITHLFALRKLQNNRKSPRN
jgi:hypothetical protein